MVAHIPRDYIRPRFQFRQKVFPMFRGVVFLLVLAPALCFAQPEPRPDPLDPTYEHDRWETKPKDIVRHFRAYSTSFDGPDDNDGDGDSDLWGIPEWVSYEIRAGVDQPAFEDRPSPWLTDRALFNAGIAPADASYKNSGYDRGHMCMREISRRLGRNADWNTHTTLNAVPQLHDFNAGYWLSLEKLTGMWANSYDRIWIICGPIVLNRLGHARTSEFIGDNGEMRVAVPQHFFKIVVRESGDMNRPHVLAFIYPHDERLSSSSTSVDHTDYLFPVREIENRTGLNFFSGLSQADQNAIETDVATEIWQFTVSRPVPDSFAERAGTAKKMPPLPSSPETIDRLYEQDVDSEQEPRQVKSNVTTSRKFYRHRCFSRFRCRRCR